VVGNEGRLVNIAHGELVEKELDAMIERRSRNGEVEPDEKEAPWMESARRYNARRQEEMRAAWCCTMRGRRRVCGPFSRP